MLSSFRLSPSICVSEVSSPIILASLSLLLLLRNWRLGATTEVIKKGKFHQEPNVLLIQTRDRKFFDNKELVVLNDKQFILYSTARSREFCSDTSTGYGSLQKLSTMTMHSSKNANAKIKEKS